MITLYVNDLPVHVNKNSNLQQVLALSIQSLNLQLDNIAAVHNQHLVPKSQWAISVCNENDQIEIFSAVAGG
ncbi:sulfur carrier protein ThiS [Aliiglaciecola sp. 3_MG-2023]|uniref:sulfur carrier protein ThiS n=1 Tax=Aliiglaciecola sp. 3_MG-2023 TaxID=3062644 RepID=UPI0026E3CCEC|nr:sulfur carrier protein ThiS [Aliiglaciecola sp. 3_MG-2023]MDO6694940.1 sulfur carrier protein ThiS [Aliiglaciecola sp. 3_MG-2023]